MHIAEFQHWVKETDHDTQWDVLTAPQLLSHLAEEMGEVAQAVNRIYRGAQGRQDHLANLRRELMDAFWLLAKLANRFGADLDEEAQRFTRRVGTWSPSTIERYRAELIASLRMLDEDLSAAKRALGLD